MPGINSVKIYAKDGIYHVYNRGNNKQKIFRCGRDYEIFEHYLNRYVTKQVLTRHRSYFGKIYIHAYCLMPNHFHLLVEQKEKMAMSMFMQSLQVSYSLGFNKRYDKTGHVFQGTYKGRLIKTYEDLLATAGYIHLNPSEICEDIRKYPYSSLPHYLGLKKTKFVVTTKIKNKSRSNLY